MNIRQDMSGTPKLSGRLLFILTLSCFGLVAYSLRMNIAVAAVFIMSDLGITKVQLGELFSSFLVGYTVFQLPWGIFGDRFGARAVLCIAAIIWGLTSFLTGLLPGHVIKVGFASFLVLAGLRFVLGMGQAAAFPVAARAIASAMPRSSHCGGYSLVIAGFAAGSALTPPIVSRLMVSVGWRGSFYVTSGFAFVLAGVWYAVAREKALPRLSEVNRQSKFDRTSWRRLLRQPMIWKLSMSYFFESYALYVFVFWSYLYLVEQRHFTVLNGGVFTGLPFLIATLVVPAMGYLSDRWSARFGYKRGRRNFAITALTLSAVCLFLTVWLGNPFLAIATISLSVTSLLSVEAIFWSSSMEVGGSDAGAAGGILNTVGNLGGIASTTLVPILLKEFGWTIAFGSSALLLLISALIWTRINPVVDGPQQLSV